jgi:hypothetical protein
MICVLIIAHTGPALYADSLENAADIRRLTDQAMSRTLNGEFEEAINVLEKYSDIDTEQINVMKAQMREEKVKIIGTYGNVLETLFLKEEIVGNCLLRMRYLSRHERYVLVWEFIFFRGKENWKLVNYYFHDKIEELFDS